jgi:two-component system, cell cycle response regulator DivK
LIERKSAQQKVSGKRSCQNAIKWARQAFQFRAWDGEANISAAKERRPDLILMDIQLPLMDGYEATRRIKADPELKNIPVIAVTSYALIGDDGKAHAAGCDAYVTKPYSPRELLAKDSSVPAPISRALNLAPGLSVIRRTRPASAPRPLSLSWGRLGAAALLRSDLPKVRSEESADRPAFQGHRDGHLACPCPCPFVGR